MEMEEVREFVPELMQQAHELAETDGGNWADHLDLALSTHGSKHLVDDTLVDDPSYCVTVTAPDGDEYDLYLCDESRTGADRYRLCDRD